jgi:hypothetical protein
VVTAPGDFPFPDLAPPVPGPGVAPAPAPGVGPDPAPGTGPGPSPSPVPHPALPSQFLEVRSSASSGVNGRYGGTTGLSSDAPPGQRNKERKINVRSKYPRSWVFLNALTEAQEFIDDLWRSLPKSMKTKRFKNGKRVRASTLDKMKDLYRHWHHADVPEMVVNVFNDQLADFFWAIPGRFQSKAAQHLFRQSGLANYVSRGDHAQRWRTGLFGNSQPGFIPQVHYKDPSRRYEVDDFLKW